MNLEEIEREFTSETVIEKTWEVPAHSGKGPVTVRLRLPEVTITGSEGWYIVISPEQAKIVSSKMEDIAYWLADAAELGRNKED